MTRIFMYSTHPTLVDHESQLFYNLGHEVYTAAWATKTRSNWLSSDIYLNPLHFYKGGDELLTPTAVRNLSKIDIGMTDSKFDNKVAKTLLDNFDILYVSQITPWLMNYAPTFLKANKPVLFRTFCYPLQAWGQPNDYQNLYKYKNFYIVPTHYKEVDYGTFGGYERIRLVSPTLCEDLVIKNPTVKNEKFILSVLQCSKGAEDRAISFYKNVINLRLINRQLRFVDQQEYNYLYNNCYLYLDFVTDLLRYSVFEALLRSKPILVMKDGDMHKFMVHTGFSSSIECFHRGFDDAQKVKFFLDNPGALSELLLCEKNWLKEHMKKNIQDWKNLFEEIK